MTVEQAALIAAWVAIVLLAFAMSGLARQLMLTKGPQSSSERPPISIGMQAPVLEGLSLRDGKARVLLFAEQACKACERLWPAYEELSRRHDSISFLALYANSASLPSTTVEVLSNMLQAFVAFGVPLTPFTVAVDHEGVVRAAEPVASELSLQLVVMSVTSIEEGSPVHER